VDVLGEVLGALALRSQLYFRAELAAPFAVAVPAEPDVIRFHVVARGACHVALASGEATELCAGDLVLVPHGAAHAVADAPGRAPTPLPDAIARSGFDGSAALRHGGDGAVSVLVCGHFAFGAGELHPILASLPPLLVLRGEGSASWAWVEAVVRHIEHETGTPHIGSDAVVRRLSEILLVEVLRAHAAANGDSALAALADPHLGRALAAIHAEPHAAWTLDALARRAGHSRTVFVERFRARLGMTPMQYLQAWRMRTARRLLAHSERSVGEVARRVGYASESAFHRAFRDHFGAAPGAMREPAS